MIIFLNSSLKHIQSLVWSSRSVDEHVTNGHMKKMLFLYYFYAIFEDIIFQKLLWLT